MSEATRFDPVPVSRGFGAGWFAGLLLAAVLLLGYGLVDRPLQVVDEGIHAAVSVESLQGGEWLMPTLAGEPYYRKPPLKLWMSSGLMALLGPDLWSVRLPSLFAGVLCALLLALWTWQLGGSRLQAVLAALCFASMRPTFHHSFRTGEMDGLLTLSVTAGLYCWWRARGDRSRPLWPALFGACLGFGFMVKAAPALLPVLVVGVDSLLARRRPSWRAVATGAAAFFAIVLPWHVAVSIVHGAPFWERYLGVEVFERVQRPLHTGERSTLFYFRLLPAYFFPLSVALLPALPWAVRGTARNPSGRAAALRVFLLWFALGLAVITVMQSKASWYLVPVLPAALALALDFLTRARPLAGDRLASWGYALMVWTFFAILPGIVLDESAYVAWRGTSPLLTHPVVLASAATVVVVVAARPLRRVMQPGTMARCVLTGMLLAHLAVWVVELRRPYPESSLAPLARDLGSQPEPVRLVTLAPLHWLDPAGYFHLLREPAVAVTFAVDPTALQSALEAADGERRAVLVDGDTPLPAAFAGRLEPAGRYGDYRLFRTR